MAYVLLQGDDTHIFLPYHGLLWSLALQAQTISARPVCKHLALVGLYWKQLLIVILSQ